MNENNVFTAVFTFIDLFSGAGGLSLGFHRAGFKCVQAIDNNTAAVQTFRLNFSTTLVIQEEITEDTPLLDDADVIVGGPPCQGFSSAGRRRPDDERNSLVSVFAKLVAKYRPKAFVFENVEGFFTADGGKRVFDLLELLIQAGYRIHLRKINAANYGVPQLRKRVIAIGGRGWNPTFPSPTHRAFGSPGASNGFQHLPPCPTLRDALRGLPPPHESPPGIPQGHYVRRISEIRRRQISILKPGQTMKDLPPELWHQSYKRRAFRRVKDGTPVEKRGGAPAGLRRLKWEEPSKTITGGAISEFVHPSEDRFLTLRECARIQTFPDDFVFVGSASDIALQIGNAVPPLLAEMIARTMLQDLCLLQERRVPRYETGALISFVPTLSSGKSPALKRVCDEVRSRYSLYFKGGEQLRLWD